MKVMYLIVAGLILVTVLMTAAGSETKFEIAGYNVSFTTDRPLPIGQLNETEVGAINFYVQDFNSTVVINNETIGSKLQFAVVSYATEVKFTRNDLNSTVESSMSTNGKNKVTRKNISSAKIAGVDAVVGAGVIPKWKNMPVRVATFPMPGSPSDRAILRVNWDVDLFDQVVGSLKIS